MKTKTHVRICASSIWIIVEFISCELRCVTIAYKVYPINLVTVSFLLRYQNDQGRYIHFIHTRQTVFYATNPYLDISQPKMMSWDPVIHQQEKTKQDKKESTRKPNHSPKKYQTKQKKLYIWYFQTKFNQMVISKQTSKDLVICF